MRSPLGRWRSRGQPACPLKSPGSGDAFLVDTDEDRVPARPSLGRCAWLPLSELPPWVGSGGGFHPHREWDGGTSLARRVERGEVVVGDGLVALVHQVLKRPTQGTRWTCTSRV